MGRTSCCEIPSPSVLPEDRAKNLAWVSERYLAEFAFYEQSELVEFRGRQARGLGLPESILHQFYHANAVKLVPGHRIFVAPIRTAPMLVSSQTSWQASGRWGSGGARVMVHSSLRSFGTVRAEQRR